MRRFTILEVILVVLATFFFIKWREAVKECPVLDSGNIQRAIETGQFDSTKTDTIKQVIMLSR
jgi:hypothetical protein